MGKKMFFRSFTPNPTSKARRTEDDPIVQNGLAITPADMNKMLQAGVPISAQMNAHFNDDSPAQANDWTVGIQDMRGVDAAEVFEASMDAKSKIKKFFSSAKREPMEKGGD